MAGRIEYIEKPSNPSINKFNAYFFEYSCFDTFCIALFAGIKIILYLWGITRKYSND